MSDAFSIPLAAVPSQTVRVTLGAQSARIAVYQKQTSVPGEAGALLAISPLFLDLYLNDALVIAGVLCLHAVRIVRDDYLGFVGDLVFYDTLGTSDPTYDGLVDRYVLTWQPGL